MMTSCSIQKRHQRAAAEAEYPRLMAKTPYAIQTELGDFCKDVCTLACYGVDYKAHDKDSYQDTLAKKIAFTRMGDPMDAPL